MISFVQAEPLSACHKEILLRGLYMIVQFLHKHFRKKQNKMCCPGVKNLRKENRAVKIMDNTRIYISLFVTHVGRCHKLRKTTTFLSQKNRCTSLDSKQPPSEYKSVGLRLEPIR